jgi:hypothetical protein
MGVYKDSYGGLVPGVKSDNTKFNWASDPMDLFGTRAKKSRDKVAEINAATLDMQQEAQKKAYLEQITMQQPYYNAGVNALSQLSDPGEIPLSEQYQNDYTTGTRSLNRALAASGKFNSSDADLKLGQFYNQLGGEEIGRRYNNAIAPIKIGQNAMGAQSQAADTYGSGMSSAYQNYGNSQASNALAYGQNRADAYNTMGQSLNSMAQYYGR